MGSIGKNNKPKKSEWIDQCLVRNFEKQRSGLSEESFQSDVAGLFHVNQCTVVIGMLE